jgi:glycosyltransferase involved in cell wall biosynthesis
MEEEIVAEVCLRHGHGMGKKQRIPQTYWDAWREECELCDSIVVNSLWSRQALIRQGVTPEKLYVVPLAYDPPAQSYQFKRRYPGSFNRSRPLRVLFLGSLIARKGIHELLAAASTLRTAPVQFLLVGPKPTELAVENTDNLQWRPSVARTRVHDFYRSADVFILPTHSDGFGLTQLEAMAWGLPVIASQSCGDVVTHNANGIILSAVDREEIVQAINTLLDSSLRLKDLSDRALETSKAFYSDRIISRLLRCNGSNKEM